MHKKKTSNEQGFCFENMQILDLKKDVKLKTHHPERSFKSFKKVGAALLESLIENDTEAFIEILDSYLRINRSRVAKKANMARSTVQQALSKNGNPTLKTLAKIVHESFI
jgi:DNA-binding phage protein